MAGGTFVGVREITRRFSSRARTETARHPEEAARLQAEMFPRTGRAQPNPRPWTRSS